MWPRRVTRGGRRTAEAKRDVVARVEGLILATDMGRHAQYVAALHALLERRPPPPAADGPCGSGGPPARGSDSDDERQLMAELLIKCADVSNVFKPFPVARRWAVPRPRTTSSLPVARRHADSRPANPPPTDCS